MNGETLAAPALRPIHLVGFENSIAISDLDLTSPELPQPPEQLTGVATEEVSTEEPSPVHRNLGTTILKAAGVVKEKVAAAVTTLQEGLTNLAIRTQIAEWNAIDYAQQKGGKAISHVALAGLALGGSAGIMSFEGVGTAYAKSNTVTMSTHYISNGNWALHPDAPTVASSVSETMSQGTEFDVQCVAVGDPINPNGQEVAATDPSADVAWEYGTDAASGNVGYVSDQGVDAQVTPGQEIAQLAALGVPECGSGGTLSQNNAPQPANPQYDRTAAVEWVLANAQDPQTNGEECTKFVSEALWAGGMKQDSTWNNNGYYPSGEPFPTIFDGSKTANSAPMLISYLEQNYSTQWIPLGTMNAGNNGVPAAQPGDIMVYSWQGANPDGSPKNMDHLAFVVADAPGTQYPEVAEWGQFANYGPADYANNPTSPYVERGWTYSEMNHMFLQNEPNQQNMTVYLLHINGGTFVPSY